MKNKEIEPLRTKVYEVDTLIYDEYGIAIHEKPSNIVDQLLEQLNPLLNNKDRTQEEVNSFFDKATQLAVNTPTLTVADVILMALIGQNESEDIAIIKLIGKLKRKLIDENVKELELNNNEVSLIEKIIPSLKIKTHIKYQLLKAFELID